jgi:hypothetical protein
MTTLMPALTSEEMPDRIASWPECRPCTTAITPVTAK